jgi:hypothetical protein
MHGISKVIGVASIIVTLAVVCGAGPSQARDEVIFTAVEKDGAKVWEGGGTIDGKSPVTLKVKNTLNAEHGFAIDTMKVKDVIKPGEEKTITVSAADIDQSVKEHRVYCHLHGKHVPATLKVSGK